MLTSRAWGVALLLPPVPAFLIPSFRSSGENGPPGLLLLLPGLPYYPHIKDVAIPGIDVGDKLLAPSCRAGEAFYHWSYRTLCTLLECAMPNHRSGSKQCVPGRAISLPHRPQSLADWSQMHQVGAIEDKSGA